MDEKDNQFKLDYSLKTPQERNELVKKILEDMPPDKINNKYLEILSNYILFAMTKEEKKEKNIITENRAKTFSRREVSFQKLTEQFEESGSEDAIYNMIANDKNIIFMHKVSITQRDIAEIPHLKELRQAIAEVEEQLQHARGQRRFLLKQQLIEMRKDQYVIKSSYKKPIHFSNGIKSFSKINLDEAVSINKKGEITDNSLVSLFNPAHVSALLQHYSKLKEDSYGKFWTDSYFLMETLDDLIEKALRNEHPDLLTIVILKIDKVKNDDIVKILEEKHGQTYASEYISSLWRNKIPKLIVEKAKEEYLIWYYTIKEKGRYKRCSRCGQIKLAHNFFFSKNSTSKDGFYSICKKCRNTKKKKKG